MKKIFLSIFLVLVFSGYVIAATCDGTKITDLTQDDSPTSDDITNTVNDPSGTAGDRIVPLSNILQPTEQSADPTSSSSTGWYRCTGSGDTFQKTDTGLWNISAGTYTPDPATSTTVYIGATTCGSQVCDYGSVLSTYLNPGSGDTNYSTSTTCKLDGNEGQGLLVLDTSNIPIGKTITDVSLWVYAAFVDSTPDGTISVHKMLTSPGGSSVDLANVTYNERDASGNIQWGGDTQASPLSGTDYTASPTFSTTASAFTASAFNEITSAGLALLVHDWYDGTASNYGILMLNSEDFSTVTFNSEDNSTADLRYYWEITYTD